MANLTKLQSLKAKQDEAIERNKIDISKTRNAVAAAEKDLKQAILDGDEKRQDELLTTIAKLNLRADALEKAAPEIRCYTDDDVVAGYIDYVKAHNKKAASVRERYDNALNAAYRAWREDVEMKEEALSICEQFKEFLQNKDIRLPHLDNIPGDVETIKRMFRLQLADDGIDFYKMSNMIAVENRQP